MIQDIDNAFHTKNQNVYTFFRNPGIGLYIPLYQREYSWSKNNIAQLLEDIAQGLDSITENKNKLRFLGTIIVVRVQNERNINPIDYSGLPTRIENIIDGQQRLSTIALFSTLLYKHIVNVQEGIEKIAEPQLYKEIEQSCKSWKIKLTNVFSLNLERGYPERKPKIIRGNQDVWVEEGDIYTNYKSDVAKYLAEFINYVCENEALNKSQKFDTSTRAGSNLKQIDNWLSNTVIKSHIKNTEDFPIASALIQEISQSVIWQRRREELEDIVLSQDYNEKNTKTLSSLVSSLVQLFSVAHYLLECCCFTVIQPMNEDWAFDMFQSLNATGTPLTAIETFKPSVVNHVNDNTPHRFKNSESQKSLKKVDNLFRDTKDADKKSSLTKKFLTSFALTTEGIKLSTHFSEQRKWLKRIYSKECSSNLEKQSFIDFFGNYATFYKDIWLDYNGNDGIPIKALGSHPEADITSLFIRFLKDSNHKMSIIILGRLYSDILQQKSNAIDKFIQATKIIVKFYTTWRSAQSNAGLDIKYRNFIKFPYNKDNEEFIRNNSWLNDSEIDIYDLAVYLKEILNKEGLLDKNNWKEKALKNLKFDKAKSVCKLALFISAHDTIPDEDNPGLMVQTKNNFASYMTIRKWTAEDLRSIEHIAPKSNIEWDSSLYTNEQWYQSIGNLTLLPQAINSSVSNKNWKAKLFYYVFLSDNKIYSDEELNEKINQFDISVKNNTISLLKASSYAHHLKPIVQLTSEDNWNQELVKKRAERILDLLWEWLEN